MRNSYVRGDKELRDKIMRRGAKRAIKKKLQHILESIKGNKKKSKSNDDDKDNKKNGAEDKMFTIESGKELLALIMKALAPIAANIILKHAFYTKKGQLYLQIKLNSSICKLGIITIHYMHGVFITKLETGLGSKFKWENESLFDIPSTISLIIEKMTLKLTTRYIPSKDIKKKKRHKKLIKKAKRTKAMKIRIGKIAASA